LLPMQRCRRIVGGQCHLDDAQLETLRDQLYGLARVIVNTYPGHNELDFSTASRSWASPQRELLEERAAVREFDAGVPRNIAESLAVLDLWRERRRP
jgi:hypothetical protein